MLVVVAALGLFVSADAPKSGKVAKPPATPREALKPFNVLVGSWKGTGMPEGTREQRAAGLWTETVGWGWQFDKDDAWLTASFAKGKYFKDGELRYSVEKQTYQLTLTTTDKKKQIYSGKLKDKVLTLVRSGGPAGEEQRIVFSLLHHNRHLYRLETRAANSAPEFTKMWQVGATKEGVPFAEVPKGPECIVSGGLGTMKVIYKGKEYYFCCTGCRDAFKEDPEKWIEK
ncbi:MAG TPA: YHS domain-containing protein [Urbifossiella sp.]|nr:YHS domain-containing protein [Urbifossiella sp.]